MADDSKRLPSTSSDEEEFHVYRLRIHDATTDDAGEWQCEVEDKYGAVSTTCNIDILEEVRKRAVAAMRQASLQEEALKSYRSEDVSSSQVVQNGTMEDSDDEGEYQEGRYDENYITKFMDRSALLEEEPSFIQSLRNTKVQEGRDFRLTCFVSGNPKPDVKWFKNNVEVVNDKRHRIVTYQDGMTFLEVRSANIKLDSKVYRCEVTSCLGISSTEAKITVMESKDYEMWDQFRGEYNVDVASIQKQSRTQNVKKVQIDDSSVSDRVLKRLKSEERSLRELYSRQREPILKLNIRWEDSQQFFFKEHLKSKCVVDGAAVNLSCFVSGIPPFFVMWYKDNKPMMNNVYERYHIRTRGGHLSLEIPCTSLDDTGEYSCEVRNEQGHIVSACYVQVEPMTDPYVDYCRPYFAKNVHNVRIEYGGSATFSCIVKGSPKPGLTWFKDGRALNQSNKITMHSGEKGLCLLKIHDADYTDTGLYKCEAHNMAGRCQSSANLIVFGEPTPRYRRISMNEEVEIQEKERDFAVAVFEGEDMYLSQNSKDIFVKPPKFARPMPPKMTVKEGQMILFDCRSEGFPRPTGQWFFEDQPIKENSYIRIIGVKNIHTLEIKSAETSRDSGKYTLKLTNPSGETCYSNCYVTVVTKTTEIQEEEIETSRTKVTESAITSKSKWAQLLRDEEDTTVRQSASKTKAEKVTTVSEEITEKAAKMVEAAVAEAAAEVARSTDVVDAASKAEVTEEAPVEAAKEAPVEAAKEAPVEAAKETPVEAAKEAPVEAAKETPVEAAKEAPVEAAKEAPVEAAKETPVGAAKEAPVEAAKETPVEAAKEAPVEAAKEAPVEAAKEAPVEAAKEAPVEATKEAPVEAAKEVEATKEAPVEAAKEAPVEAAKEAPVEAVEKTAETVPEKPCAKAEEEVSSPTFVESLQPEYSFVDTAVNVKFRCKVRGNPAPSLAWWKGGIQLETGANINIEWNASTGEGTLMFKSLSPQDSGKYECVASSARGSCISSTIVTVTKPDKIPTLVQGLDKDYSFVFGETNVKLTCKWEGQPAPTVEWFQDGKKLSASDSMGLEWSGETGVACLVFKSLSVDMSGSYECVATSSVGTAKSATNVSVKKPDKVPTVVQGLDKDYSFVDSDTNVKLTCKWEGQPAPTVEWYRDGKKLSASDSMGLEWSAETGVASLVFKSLSVDMSGSYECVATSSVGTAKSATKLSVKKPDKVPTVVHGLDMDYSFVDSDTNVKLTCKWEGQPAPTVEWYKDGKKLSASDSMGLEWSAETGMASLVFKSLNVDMSGSYECVATSSVGTAKSATNVSVKKAEKVPTEMEALKKEYSFVDTETNVCLQCKWDGNPSPSVEWYKDGKKLSASDSLGLEWSAETGVASLVFKSLSVDMSGSYECVATSSVGTAKSATNVSVKKPDKVPTVVQGLDKDYSFVDSDTNIKLTCKWEGQPAPTVEWYKDGKKLSASDSLGLEWSAETGVASLVFKSLSVDMSGSYECVATSSVGTAKSATNVSVKKAEKAPTAMEALKKEYSFVDTERNVHLQCKWDGNPSPSVQWYKDGKKLSVSDSLGLEWSAETGVASLVFKSLSVDMSGSYECVATSSVGTAKSATNVSVKKKPEVLKPLDKSYDFLATDTNVKLQCQVEGNPSPEISWLKDGTPLKASDRVKFEWDADTGAAALVFASISEQDSGNYECVAKSSLGTTKSPAAVTVKKPKKVPTVVKPLEGEYTFVETDTNVRIQCQLEGNPAPEISWTKDGMELEAGGRIKFEWNADTGMAGVIFRKLNLMDSGNYECVATSSLGSTKSSTSVCVNKPDKTPEVCKPLQKEYNFLDTDTNVRLQCQVDGSPVPDITWFKDGKPVKAGGRLKMDWNADTGSAALVFSRLTPEDSGNYECVAKSRVGETKCATVMTVKKPEKKPEVVQGLKLQYNFTEGDENVCLQCTMEGYPAPEVAWYRGGKKVEPSDNIVFEWDADSGVASLTFKQANCDDSGNYECVATSSLGTSRSPTTLQIKKPEKKPTVLEPLKSDYNYLDTDVDVTLQCKLDGYPVPTVQWLKNGNNLTADSNMSIAWDVETGVASLVFKTLSVSNTGKYECVAKSTIGTTKSATAFTVKKPEKVPTVVKDLAGEYNFLDTDTNVLLQCQVAGYPDPKVTWMKDGKKLEEIDNLKFEWDAGTGTAALKFRKLNCDDTGKYECVATSSIGSTSSSAAVSVKKPEKMPAVVQPLEQEYTYEEGDENVSITCKFEGYPAPTISWTQNGKKLKPADYVRFDWDPETGVAAMVFTETMSPLDTGSYECIATSPKGTCKSTTQITVNKPMRKPNILVPLETEYTFALNEKNVRLQCKVDGNPAPDVYWVKNGEKMIDCRNAIFEWNENTGKAALILKKVSIKDSGEYQCVGFSNIGSSKTTTTINVQAPDAVAPEDIVPEAAVPAQTAKETGPPVFTDMAVSQTVPVGGVAVFKCIIISHTPAEFKWKKDSVDLSSTDRVTISITEKETSLTIATVQLTDRGTFSCVAKNQHGQSETSGELLVEEMENLIKAKRRKTWSGVALSDDDVTENSKSKKGTEGEIITSTEEADGSVDLKTAAEEVVAKEAVQESQSVAMAEQQTEVSMTKEQAATSESAAVVEASVQKEETVMAEQISKAKSAETSQAVSFVKEESSVMATEKVSSSSQSSEQVSVIKETSEQVSMVSASKSAVESRTESVMSSDQGEKVRQLTKRDVIQTSKSATVKVLEDFESSVSKLQESMSQTTVQESSSSASASSNRIEILEVKAVPVSRASGSVTERQHHRHEHHAPELIIPAHSQSLPEHSDIELMVKVKAAKHAHVKWLHDGKTVTQTGHYEMVEEEEKITK